MAYLEQLQREIKDFLAPFSTIQLKKKRTIITTRFFLNAHIKTTKQHLHPLLLYSIPSFFKKIAPSIEGGVGWKRLTLSACDINHQIVLLSPAIEALQFGSYLANTRASNLQLFF